MHLEWSVVEKTQFAFWLWSDLSFSCLIFAWKRKEAARIPFKARIHLQYINCFHPYVHGGESIPSSCAVSHSSLQLMLLGIPSVRLCHVVETYILAFKISRVPWVIAMHSGMHFVGCLWWLIAKTVWGKVFCKGGLQNSGFAIQEQVDKLPRTLTGP